LAFGVDTRVQVRFIGDFDDALLKRFVNVERQQIWNRREALRKFLTGFRIVADEPGQPV
jgi:hypothetical protein